jgi:thiol-disulfide isomerase/thioredoxin
MSRVFFKGLPGVVSLVAVLVAGGSASVVFAQGAGVKVEQVLAYRPAQSGVEYETPTAEEVPQCKLDLEKQGKNSAWVVFGPQGQVIRRFVDTDGNGKVDEFRYFQHGLEVYRDADRNENQKIDEFRWFNTAGTRWGVDTNEDGRIDEWKRLSAEEATREMIAAMAAADPQAVAVLLVTADDLRRLGISAEVTGKLLEAVKDPATRVREILSGSKVLTAKTKWVRFDTSMLMPNLIPIESGKASQELTVYENVMAIVDNSGETGFVQIGELVKVGDVWKFTQFPRPVDGNAMQVTEGGLLMQPSLSAVSTAAGPVDLTPEIRALLEQLQKLDEGAPTSGASVQAMTRYNVDRAKLLGQLASAASTADEKEQWLKQQVDGIAAAAQASAYPDGLKELQAIEAAMQQQSPVSTLLPYVGYRRLLADYNERLQKADAKQRSELQGWWAEQLEQFARAYPKSEDTPDALLQLAITLEFAGKTADARQWYEALAQSYRTAPAARRAVGAVRRLSLVGKSLAFAGSALGGGGQINTEAYRGKVLLVIFWATWCTPCTEDLPQIQALLKQYRSSGFEVLGVNVDVPEAPIREYLQQYRVEWPHIHETGGLESRPALEFGVISLPTMILADRTGKVVTVGASVDDLKKAIPELLRP